MAKSKGGGATRLGRDARPKYLGIKISEGQAAKVGQILIRQRGLKFIPGKNAAQGRDRTLYALKEGKVRFTSKTKRGFNRSQKVIKVVNIEPVDKK